jgi:hypothetical protein
MRDVAAHMWLRVPPFAVLDITLRGQPWDPERRPYFQPFVLSERSLPSTATVEQLVDMNAIEKFAFANGRPPTMREVARCIPHVFPFMERFPSFSVDSISLVIDYAPTKFSASLEPLADMQPSSQWTLAP